MSHRLSTLLLLFVCFLGMTLSLWGQNTAAVHGIRGYLDPRTHVFHSIPEPQDADAQPPAKTTFTGTFVFNFTITVSSALPSTDQIFCVGGASLVDGSTNPIVDLAATAVSRGTGTTVTCSVTLPYSWALASATTDKVSLSYSVGAPASFALTAQGFPKREGSQSLGTITVPVSGTTTTETITARM